MNVDETATATEDWHGPNTAHPIDGLRLTIDNLYRRLEQVEARQTELGVEVGETREAVVKLAEAAGKLLGMALRVAAGRVKAPKPEKQAGE